jgi:hypothetical protein
VGGANRQRSLAGDATAGERRPGFRAIGAAVSRIAKPLVGKRGGGLLVRLKSDWPAIVGSDWSAVAWPVSLGRDGAIKLRAAPAAALELQHRAPLLIERINRYFGRAVAVRLVLVQGSLPPAAPPVAPAVPPLASAEAQALDDRLADISDPELRAALDRLGRAIIVTQK